MTETSLGYQTSKMERWRFMFPETLATLLPAPFVSSSRILTGFGIVDNLGLRNRIMKIRDVTKRPTTFHAKYSMEIVDGLLHLGDKKFSTRLMLQRLHAGWAASLDIKPGKEEVSLVAATLYGFDQLRSNEWIHPSVMMTWLKIFCPSVKQSDPETICRIGWEWGCLAKQRVGDQTWYQSTKIPQEEEKMAEADYLADQGDGWVVVNLAKKPFTVLELLANISIMTVDGTRLLAKPHFIRLGGVFPTIQTHPLLTWLKVYAPAFSKEIEIVAKRYGKHIIHENLLIAKIQDLSLKVKIEQQFFDSGKIVSLSKEYLAFPKGLLPDIERIVKKSGHVIKKES